MDLNDLILLRNRAPSWFQHLADVALPAASFGFQSYPSGAITLGLVKNHHPGEERWFHTFYPGLNLKRFNNLQVDFGLRVSNPDVMSKGLGPTCGIYDPLPDALPSDYLEFLSLSNGARLFSSHLYFFGVRTELGGNATINRQPYELSHANVFDRPKWSDPSLVFIGGYGWDRSLLVMTSASERVTRREAVSGAQLKQWGSFSNMLVSECDRLIKRFDNEGSLVDRSIATTP